jgi:hypothetical protein
MTTINQKDKFFWTKIQKNFQYFLNLLTIIISIGLLIFIFSQKEGGFQVQSIKTNNGWGYAITKDKRIIIKQTIIPVISQRKSFATEKEALQIGNLVLHKLENNISPTITKKDLLLLEIKI